jgi:hypothetical protein
VRRCWGGFDFLVVFLIVDVVKVFVVEIFIVIVAFAIGECRRVNNGGAIRPGAVSIPCVNNGGGVGASLRGEVSGVRCVNNGGGDAA